MDFYASNCKCVDLEIFKIVLTIWIGYLLERLLVAKVSDVEVDLGTAIHLAKNRDAVGICQGLETANKIVGR